ESGENCGNCPQDCGTCTPVGPYCGDGSCARGEVENYENCPSDCPGICGDGLCEAWGYDNHNTCGLDCGCYWGSVGDCFWGAPHVGSYAGSCTCDDGSEGRYRAELCLDDRCQLVPNGNVSSCLDEIDAV